MRTSACARKLPSFDEHSRALFAQAVRSISPLTVVLGDIDRFKEINDRFSHAVGDAVLRQVGAILRDRVRGSDLLARYGGEEFALAFPDTTGEQALRICEEVRQRIESYPWSDLHPRLQVTISLGVCAERALGGIEAMLAAADRALYRAKEMGRNRVCCDDS